jgi:hypothetical protein
MTGSSFGLNTITPGSYALNVNGQMCRNGIFDYTGNFLVGYKNTIASFDSIAIS